MLNLDLTHIFGDVQVFQATKSLMELSLKSTDVTGAVIFAENLSGINPPCGPGNTDFGELWYQR